MEEEKKKNNIYFLIIIGVIAFAILYSFYSFYFKKDFDFVIELSCDNTKEVCIIRDCTNEYDCPPNGLSSFSRYILKASDFTVCDKKDCMSFCKEKESNCIKLECEENIEYGESCSGVLVTEADILNELEENNSYINN